MPGDVAQQAGCVVGVDYPAPFRLPARREFSSSSGGGGGGRGRGGGGGGRGGRGGGGRGGGGKNNRGYKQRQQAVDVYG